MQIAPLVNNNYLLEKMPGKGGWTYVAIGDVIGPVRKTFGMVRVKGLIDDYELQDFHLMPMADGRLFFPVKAEIRKEIKKREGAWVKLVLYPDNSPLHIPDELMMCLYDEPMALDFFNKLADNEKRNYIKWIFGAKRMETRVDRIAKCISKMLRGLRLYDKES